MSRRARIRRAEIALGPAACATCHAWPGDLTARCLGDDDPWLRLDGRYCPDCPREPPITLPLSALIADNAADID
jgi:hypothetical protein